jgi:hypothetical protein
LSDQGLVQIINLGKRWLRGPGYSWRTLALGLIGIAALIAVLAACGVFKTPAEKAEDQIASCWRKILCQIEEDEKSGISRPLQVGTVVKAAGDLYLGMGMGKAGNFHPYFNAQPAYQNQLNRLNGFLLRWFGLSIRGHKTIWPGSSVVHVDQSDYLSFLNAMSVYSAIYASYQDQNWLQSAFPDAKSLVKALTRPEIFKGPLAESFRNKAFALLLRENVKLIQWQTKIGDFFSHLENWRALIAALKRGEIIISTIIPSEGPVRFLSRREKLKLRNTDAAAIFLDGLLRQIESHCAGASRMSEITQKSILEALGQINRQALPQSDKAQFDKNGAAGVRRRIFEFQ